MQIDVTPTSTPETDSQYCGQSCVKLYNTQYSRVSAFESRKERFLILSVGEETVVVNVSAPVDKPEEFFSKSQELLDTLEWKGV